MHIPREYTVSYLLFQKDWPWWQAVIALVAVAVTTMFVYILTIWAAMQLGFLGDML